MIPTCPFTDRTASSNGSSPTTTTRPAWGAKFRKRLLDRMGCTAGKMLGEDQDAKAGFSGFQRAGTKLGISWFLAAGSRRMRSRR